MDFDRLRPPSPTTGIDPTWSQASRDSAEAHQGKTAEHAHWMNEALGLARSMQGWVWPNPAVGCVIVREGGIVGRGQTQVGGRPHAERVALEDAGDKARGATLYVTLEPCCHWGKTPPCADAIIAAGVSTVFASLQDPDPRVNGGGFRKLGEAGIEVHVGLGAEDAHRIMAGFFHRIDTGMPLVAIGEIGGATSFIPDGFDAVIRHAGDRHWLLTRAPNAAVRATQVAYSVRSASALLQELGRLGLTAVYVPATDPLAVELANTGASVPMHHRFP